MDLTPREIDELLGAWALGAIDPSDQARLDAAIAADPDLARRARPLQRAVTSMADGTAAPPPPGLRHRLVDTVASRPRELWDPTDPVRLFANQVQALSELLRDLTAEDWDLLAPPYEWTVHGLVAHLLVIERYTAVQLGLAPSGPAGPPGHLEMGADEIAEELIGTGPETAAAWRTTAQQTVRALAADDAPSLGQPLELHGWPFSVATGLVARSFEVWTHADDIRRATGRPLADPAPEDLRAMSQVSVTSLPLILPLIDGEPGTELRGARVVLTGDGGGTFDLGDPSRRDALLVADVADYCRLAARRIEPAALDATIEGDRRAARRLLAAAQAFAV